MKATLHFDGACRGNPGGRSAGAAVLKFVIRASDNPERIDFPNGVGLMVYDKDGTTFVRAESKPIVVLGPVFNGTNNEAEWHGLLAGLHEALKLNVDDLTIYGDSKLVVEQVAGRWRVKKPHLKPLHGEAKALLANFDRWSIKWIPREHNTEADRESNHALDKVRA